MIGEIRKAITPYFDLATNSKRFKTRPVLIIALADNKDYVCLPISTISRKENLNSTYDIEVNPSTYPKLNLHRLSYIRTHKQTIIHATEILDLISNLSKEYRELYVQVLKRREEFSREISRQALAV